MAKRTYALLVAMLLLIGGVLASSVMAQGNDGPPADDPQYQEEAVRRLFDEDGKLQTTGGRLSKVAEDHEGGFGGFYFDGAERGKVYVYMKDPSNIDAARAAFNAAYEGRRTITRIVAVQGDYAFNDLVQWFHALDAALVENDIHPTAGSVRELDNKIRFGLSDMSQVRDAERIMSDLGIPAGAVYFEEERVIVLVGKDSVTAKWRPLVGGVKHKADRYGPDCTIGFVTRRGSLDGLVVPSHCTNEEMDFRGPDEANIHQPQRPWFGGNKVAEETIDPYMSSIDHEDCPSEYRCRYSDSAFAELEDDEDIDRGKIAKPEDVGETYVSPSGTTFQITSEGLGFSVGDEVHYVGISGGWRTAEITATCDYSTVRPAVNGLGHRLLCVGKAEVTDGDNPTQGDSGAPVFFSSSGSNVGLLGILSTGSATSADEFGFSKLGFIYYELDPLSAWNTCVSGC